MSLDSVIRQPRVIVLCFDGTSNQYNSMNTNVVKFYALLDKCRPFDQIVYYQPGIGTFFNPGVVSPLLEWLARTADLAIAWYLNAHVRAGYKFLMQNYRQGDKICLFGFSRGAYTARALAGFLFKIGLLPKDNEEQIPFAYRLYKRTDEIGCQLAAGYKRTFCTPVTIDFVGVWDTVASVGWLYGRNLPFTTDNEAIRVFRHALALDEHRAKFQPNMFHRTSPDDESAKKDPEHASRANTANLESYLEEPCVREPPRPKMPTTWRMTVRRLSEMERYRSMVKGNGVSAKSKAFAAERSALRKTELGLLQSVEEVWFAGCHTDVGGGSVADDCRYSLADIPLRWMVKQVVLSQCGILFDQAALRRADIDIANIVYRDPNQPTVKDYWKAGSQLSKSHSPASSSEDVDSDDAEEMWPVDQDVLSDCHDQLKMRKAWWTLEMLPMKYAWQDAKGKWHAKWGFNTGKGRKIREEEPYFHRSVKERMDVRELNYRPRAQWNVGKEHYVD